MFFNSDPLKKNRLLKPYISHIYLQYIYDNIVRYIHTCPYVYKFVLVGSRSKATIHNRCVYINRNRRRKIIGRGNSLSASIRSSTPPLAHYTIIYYFVAFRKFDGWPIRERGSNKNRVHLDWREYLRAGFASGHGPASGSRRVLASRRYEEGEREREREIGGARKGRASVEGRRRDTRQTERERDGALTHTTMCAIGDACAPRRPNLQSSSYTSPSDRISRLGFSTNSSILYVYIYIYIYKEAPILFHFLFFSIFFFPALFNVAPT